MHAGEQLPDFITLARKPSWVNRAGRVDRSACMEVRVTELRQMLEAQPWTFVRSSTGKIAHTQMTIDARTVYQLHCTRLPRHLVGDLRTPKSNAMKQPTDPPPGMRKHLGPYDQPWIALPDMQDALYSNPNKGAAQSKRLGLWHGGEPAYTDAGPWTQNIRIERWQKKHSAISGQQSARTSTTLRKSKIENPESTIPSPPTPPTFRHYLICPRCESKVFKLFMILATEQEVNDAEIAEGWIKMFDARTAAAQSVSGMPLAASRSLQTLRAALINRYQLLFRDRRLVCKTCLGIRYGEVKKNRRTVQAESDVDRKRRTRRGNRHI